jgi:uracil-DNA glycosylase
MAAVEADRIAELNARVVACRACPRLVAWREEAAADPPRRYRGESYWARPVPGFGDPAARILVVGLAPAAHGANRTGRMFTGDRSGEWLYAALHRAGLANQPESLHAGDGLELDGAYVSAVVRCAPPANKPTPAERDACRPWLEAEVALLPDIEVVLALGAFGFREAARWMGFPRAPTFAHGAEARSPDGRILMGCYHVSQQNTFTGRLTQEMLDAVLSRAVELTEDPRL